MGKLAAPFLVVIGLLLFGQHADAPPKTVPSGNSVTSADVQGLILAIQDETYDEGCQGYGFDASATHDDRSYQLPLYVDRSFNAQGIAWSIYKLLPIGEVLRAFGVDNDGLATIYGHPEWRFPPTELSYLTVYMNDDELAHLKHDWMRTSFTLELRPTAARLQEAASRQKMRLADGYRSHKRDCSFAWRKAAGDR